MAAPKPNKMPDPKAKTTINNTKVDGTKNKVRINEGTTGPDQQNQATIKNKKSETGRPSEDATNNETVDTRKSQANIAASKAKIAKKKSLAKVLRDEEDNWDDDLIPQWLIDEIYAELDAYPIEYEEGELKKEASEEILDDRTKKALTDEERKKLKEKRFSLPDVEGAVPKETLRKLSNKTIRKLILHAKKEIERYETENYLFERTIEKLEKPEKAIEEMRLGSEEDASQNAKDTGPKICPSESEEEVDDTGEYVPMVPMNEINISTDSFFDNMSDNSKEAAVVYFQNIGEIAPSNFDVMRFKYGELVKGAEEDPAYSINAGVKSRLNAKVFESKALLDDKTAALAANTSSKPMVAPRKLDLNSMFEEITDEDPEYPGFSMSTAKELPLEDKLKFALEEEEEFRHQFYKHETLALREEGAIQVHIDAHKHSIRLLLNLRKDFRTIMKDARHPLTGKLMAEMILRFKRKMRNQISAEETKARMTIRKIMAIKKRAIHQLKTNKESGNAISQIDFEHLMVENQIFVDEMEEMNLSLKYLKQLSGHFFQILKEDQDSIGRLNQEDLRLKREIETKRNVMRSFEKTYRKYRMMIYDTNAKMDELKRKLSEYHAPKPLEYIRLKACQYEMESDVTNLQKKLDEINLSLITARSTFAMYCKMLPDGDQTAFANETWLDEVKREVAENGLMSLLENDPDRDAEDFPSAFKSKSVITPSTKDIKSKSPSSSKKRKVKSGRLKTAQTILLAPSKALARRKTIKPSMYDQDFQYELSSPVLDLEDTTMM